MKINIPLNKIECAPEIWLRSAGYHYHEDRRTGQASFSRPLGAGDYPRFHIYLSGGNDSFTLNLHLDQKKPSYQGSHAHSGEYEGAVVEREIERLKSLLVR